MRVVACDYYNNILLLEQKNNYFVYTIQSYNKQHGKQRRNNVLFSILSKYSSMIVVDVAYVSNSVYILFENGNIISQSFGVECVKHCSTDSNKNLSFYIDNLDDGNTNDVDNDLFHNCAPNYTICLNGGTCFHLFNHKQCWCKLHYFGKRCQFQSKLDLALTITRNIR